MVETTEEYRTRINQLKTSIENEPYIKKMRENIAEGISKTGNRQADIEEQFQEVIDNTTGKDVISAPELIAARNGEANLKARLDKEQQQVNAQLAQTMTQTEFDSWVATLLDGGPSIFMETLTALESAYPNGAEGVALVRATDPARIYVWNGTAWEDFGAYQGIELKDGTVSRPKLDAYLSGYNNNKTELRYEEGLLVEVVEKDGDLTISRVNLFYTDGKLTQITERADRRLIITNLTYHNDGRLSYTQNILGGE